MIDIIIPMELLLLFT